MRKQLLAMVLHAAMTAVFFFFFMNRACQQCPMSLLLAPLTGDVM
jgi:hypothetical protein